MSNSATREMVETLADRLLTMGQPVSYPVRRLAASTMPLDSVYQVLSWCEWMRVARNLSLDTLEKYLNDVEKLLLHLESRPLSDVDLKTVEAWHQRVLFYERRLKAETRSGMLVSVRQFFKWREVEGFGNNPVVNLVGPKRSKRVPRRFSQQQIKRLFAACDLKKPSGLRDYAILALFYATGGRRAEVATLRTEQLDLGERTGKIRFWGKGSKERVVSIDGAPLIALRAWLAARDQLDWVEDHGAVFLSFSTNKGHGLTPHGIDYTIKCLKNKTRLDARGMGCHALRTAFATDLYDNGIDIATIQLLMGHESIETTRKYIVLTDRHQATRMPAAQSREIMGLGSRTPLWLKKQQEKKFGR